MNMTKNNNFQTFNKYASGHDNLSGIKKAAG